MTKEEQARVKKAIEEYTKKANSSVESARLTLIREGIYLENGELAPRYYQEDETA